MAELLPASHPEKFTDHFTQASNLSLKEIFIPDYLQLS
jgi:hypothetical protein